VWVGAPLRLPAPGGQVVLGGARWLEGWGGEESGMFQRWGKEDF